MPRKRAKIDIVPLGDNALLVRVADDIAAVTAQRQIDAAKIPGVVETAPGFESVGIFFDSRDIVSFEEISAEILAALKQKPHTSAPKPRLIDIPATFDAESAIDLTDIAQHAGLSPNEVVDLYCSVEYCVACIGFTPGFPYLIGLPPELATPRRPAPRKKVPAGSIAIGGAQAGIYPFDSPGGWNIIGRTSMKLFDPHTDPPATLRAGDRVRFVRSTS